MPNISVCSIILNFKYIKYLYYILLLLVLYYIPVQAVTVCTLWTAVLLYRSFCLATAAPLLREFNPFSSDCTKPSSDVIFVYK